MNTYKAKTHPGAMLHTLKRILKEARGGVPGKARWDYARSILDSEHQNYNERDAIEQGERYKKELAELATMLGGRK